MQHYIAALNHLQCLNYNLQVHMTAVEVTVPAVIHQHDLLRLTREVNEPEKV